MLDYLDTAIVNAFRQILGGFGLIFLLAFLMWAVSQKRRALGGGRFGNSYYYFVAPGVMFHELGHALGCILTFTKVVEFAPFKIQGETLGYVKHVKAGRFGAVREFIIATGPVWLGCVAIFLLGLCMGGYDFFPIYGDVFPVEEPGFIAYVCGVFSSALGMLGSFIVNWNWTSPFYWILFYLLFCITSEITLSPVDLAGMWRGSFIIIFFIILINLIPGVHWLALKLTEVCAPMFFLCHVVLLFVLLIDIAFSLLFKGVLKFCSRRH
jgi:hypothetical protein